MSLEQRESFHLDGPGRERIGAMLMQLFGVHEFVLLNTCNRVEIMAVASHATASGGLLCHALGFDRLPADRYYQWRGAAAWEHSALVCAGLLSQTPGEYHVAAQIKEALAEALRQGWAAGMMQQWMASVLHLSKHIKNDAAPLVPVCEIEDLALRLLADRGALRDDKTILVIGSGMVGRELVRNAAAVAGKIIWCYHRHPPELPEAWTSRVETCMMNELDGRLPEADALVCAMDAPGFVLHGGHADLIGRTRPVVMVDLGVPRNVDPALGRLLPAAELVDLEKLNQVYGNGRDATAAALEGCRNIIHAHRDQYERLMASFQGGNTRQSAGVDPATAGG
ncbi:MAG: hypothetical protein LC725_12595 [Lentisphaerae bacterium]|nr:hypothetical protein [Lentisphaerota bacterium]